MNNILNRNEDIDNLKAIMISWVLFIHCLYWLGLFENEPYITLKSLLLFEMPLCFFLTGVNNFKSKKSTLNFILGRFERILPLYWVYSIICVILISDQLGFNERLLISWLNPFRNSISGIENLQYLNWALWFIPVYIIVIMLFPIYKKIYLRLNKRSVCKYIPLVLLACLVLFKEKLGINAFVAQVIFYTIWVYIGMFFHERKAVKKKFNFFITMITLTILIILIRKNIFTLNMQINKGETNFGFLLYSIAVMNILYLIYPLIKLIIIKLKRLEIFKWYWEQSSKNGYFIYLFHPLTFAFLPTIIDVLGISKLIWSNSLITILCYMVMVSIISAFMANWFEIFITRIAINKVEVNEKNNEGI